MKCPKCGAEAKLYNKTKEQEKYRCKSCDIVFTKK